MWVLQSADTSLAKRETQTCGSQAAREEQRASLAAWLSRTDVDTPPMMLPVMPAAVKNKLQIREISRRVDETSAWSTGSARWSDPFSQKVIGRTTPLVFGTCGRGSSLFFKDSAFALIHQPACQHGRGVFLEVLIQERSQFLAQIGRVSEAGKFIGLQRVAGSGQQELPGRLGVVRVHENLPDNVLWKRRENSTTSPYIVTSNPRVTSLWKSVQTVENALRACSGCAGDYEDPDRSAWEPDPEEHEEDTAAEEMPEREGPTGPAGEELPDAE